MHFSLIVGGGLYLWTAGGTGLLSPACYRQLRKKASVNVVVCTHNDADHANGILGFLESGLRCDEVWLPGRWLGALPDIIKPFVEVFNTLVAEVAQIEIPQADAEIRRQEEPVSPLERFAAHLRQEPAADVQGDEASPIGDDGWPEP